MLYGIMLSAVVNNGNHIEANRPVVPGLFHISGGSIGKKLFFSRRNRFGRLSKKVGTTGFNFNKYKGFAVFSDEVQLGFAVAPIDFQNEKMFAFEERVCELFACFAGVVVFCHERVDKGMGK